VPKSAENRPRCERVMRSFFTAAIGSVAQAVPMEFGHQGRLLDADGAAVNATVSLRFCPCDAANAALNV
jgi:hypothetical protein